MKQNPIAIIISVIIIIAVTIVLSNLNYFDYKNCVEKYGAVQCEQLLE